MLRAAPARHRLPSSRPPRSRCVGVAVLVLALMFAPVGLSLGAALTAPGQAPVSVRLVEWLRDHGGAPLVNAVENWWYSQPPPRSGPVDPATIPRARSTGGPTPSGPRPDALILPQDPSLPGEAVWAPSPRRTGGAAPLYTSFFRPLVQAPSVVVGVAWINQSLTHARLVAGTREPLPSPPQAGPVDGGTAAVPAAMRPGLLATFNSGFKLKDARGGFFTAGRWSAPARDRAASLVVDASGRIDIGAWGSEVGPTPTTVAVRQNLAMVVDGGVPVAGLDTNLGNAWGSTANQFQHTWRSGLGLDASGNLIYVAADKINLNDLAEAMVAAGAVRGMELDMHPQMVTFLSYDHAPVTAGRKLLPAMAPTSTRYLAPDQRDFLAVSTADRAEAP